MLDLKKYIPIKRKKLDNGLDVVFVEMHNSPIVSINLSYKVGSKNEIVGKTGFAHLFEHLMFEGSKNVPKGQFDKLCSSAGGTNNAYTTYDFTAYTMTLPIHQLELGLWLESDRMFFSEISQEALTNQQKVVIEEIKQTVENQPYSLWREKLAESAYTKDCSYSWEVHGSKDDVANSTLNDVKEFFANFYRPDNACLVIAGNIEAEKALPLVEKYFNIKQNRPPKPNFNFSESFKKGGVVTNFIDNVPLAASFLSFHTGGILDDSGYAVDVLSNILGMGKSSLLYNSLVYDKQVASQIGAYTDKREHTSLLTIYALANSPETTAEQLTAILNEELRKIKSKGIDDIHITKSKNQIISNAANEILYSSSVADNVGNQTLFWNNPDRYYSLLENYDKVNNKDIMDLFDRFINFENSVTVEVIPSA